MLTYIIIIPFQRTGLIDVHEAKARETEERVIDGPVVTSPVTKRQDPPKRSFIETSSTVNWKDVGVVVFCFV